MTRSSLRFWWILAAACFPAYFALVVYCDLTRTEPSGLQFTEGQFVVTGVAAGSPAAHAGIITGDRLIAIGGQALQTRLDLEAVSLNTTFNRPATYRVLRDGAAIDTSVTLGRAAAGYWGTRAGLVLLGLRAMQAVTLGLALLVAFRRPRDPAARIGAWLLAAAGVFCIALPYRIATIWRGLPLPVGTLLWLPCLSTYAAGALSYAFFAMFPARRQFSPVVWLATLAPMAAALAMYAPFVVRAVYTPEHATGTPLWPSKLLLSVNVAYIAAGFFMLVRNYRATEDVTDRRRVRVLVIGSICGWLGGIPVIYSYWHGAADQSRTMFASSGVTAGTVIFVLFPLSFAYAILRHRLFDLSLIARQGLRYALARRALLSLVPLLGVVLAFDVFRHSHQPLVEILRGRGSVYLVIGAAAITAHVMRPRWLDALDRRFFRERYDARRILAGLVTDMRHEHSLTASAHRVVDQIALALHPACVALLVREPSATRFDVMAAQPSSAALPMLTTASTVVRLARVLAKPIDVSTSDDGWLRAQLTDAEAAALGEACIDLLVPVASGSAGTEALLVLGVKRSEEPYDLDDRELLSAIASSFSLLLDRGVPAQTASERVAECPSCGRCHPSATARCTEDGTLLSVTHLPRVIADRYRVERRRGRGGMGTVYEARDLALDRLVAAKVMREALSASEGAADRFQQEARSAARLTHPHVVTVHDFGVTSDRIAFLIMELLDGVTLREALVEGALPAARSLAVLHDVAAAIDAAHAQRILHRDLKPENIFLVHAAGRESAKVMDFGIAKFLEHDSHSGSDVMTNPALLLGTPRYMSPEQLRGEEPRPSWDIWALSIVAFEMLSGGHPFEGAAQTMPAGMAAYEAHLARRLAPDVNPSATVFARALSLDPSSRPATASALVAALDAALRPRAAV